MSKFSKKENSDNVIVSEDFSMKPDQREVLEILSKTYGYESISVYMLEATLDQARRDTDGYSELNRDMRKKLGKEWDY